jgi:GDP-4-dehydro-6-deoxy-D-mannose reductase
VRVLVTGSAGFVGQHLAPRLEAVGWQVTGRDRDLDVTDAGAVRDEVARIAPSAVIHLAAQSSVAASFEAASLTFRVNYVGARHLLEAVRREAPGARVLLIGSGDVYGAAPPGAAPFDEMQALRPRSPYARSKACADLLGAAFAARGVDAVRVRPFNHTGPGQNEAFVLPSFARQAVEIAAGRRDPVLHVGNLDSVRDFLDVEDVVSAYLALLDRRVPAGTYNVASGLPQRVGDLLEALLARAGARARSPRIRRAGAPPITRWATPVRCALRPAGRRACRSRSRWTAWSSGSEAGPHEQRDPGLPTGVAARPHARILEPVRSAQPDDALALGGEQTGQHEDPLRSEVRGQGW